MNITTRFAPSPTGFLHIGNVRTALFNWLFTRRYGGEARLRIEDTDHARNSQDAIDLIPEGLTWLGLDWDGDIVLQSKNYDRHRDVARQLVKDGKAYYCYMTAEELEDARAAAEANGEVYRYDRRWRERTDSIAGVDPVIRLKAPLDGEMTITDLVQGTATVQMEEIDDFILLRADGVPTYMLSCVVDDHDMQITHVVRGDDHFRNAFRQTLLYQALGWDVPTFAHLPMLLDDEGKKMSKRRDGAALKYYQDQGYLPEALFNYLLRLGWSHGDDEIISAEQAIQWFDLKDVGKSPSRYDADKLNFLAGHYMKQADDSRLCQLVWPYVESISTLTDKSKDWITRAMPLLKERAHTLSSLAEETRLFTAPLPLTLDEKAKEVLNNDAMALLAKFVEALPSFGRIDHDTVGEHLKAFAEQNGVKMKHIAMPLRAALTGTMASPSLFHIMEIFGVEECQKRIKSVLPS